MFPQISINIEIDIPHSLQKEMLAEISSCSKEGVEREVAKGRIKGEVVAMVAEINDILWQTGKLIGENDLQAASLTLVKAKSRLFVHDKLGLDHSF